METFDLAVIGAGAAGLSAAEAGAALGRRVVLIEGNRLGGECTWSGCVPSKALIEAARHRHEALRAPRFGIAVERAPVDFGAVMAHVHDVVAQIALYEDADHLERDGIRVRRGRVTLEATGTDPGPPAGRRVPVPRPATSAAERVRLMIDGEPLAAGRIVVCTGSRPALPPVPGLADVPHLTNETLFDITDLPRRLVVLGGGSIGLEMAQAFRRLGSEVTVVDVVERLLPREDPEIAAVARDLLDEEGIRFVLGARVEKASASGGTVALTVAVGEDRSTVEGDRLLVAAGRRPATDGLGLEQAGISVERRGITVDRHLETTVPGVYAAGDVTGLYPFTHAAAYQGRLAARNALSRLRRAADYRAVPWVTFTDPEIAHLGLTEPEAREAHGSNVSVVTLPFTAIDRAVIQRQVRGLVKIITTGRPVVGRAGGGEVVGAHLIGPGAGDLVHEFALARQTRAFAGRLAQTIHAYPTMSVGVQQAAARLFGPALAGPLREDLRDRA